MKCVCILFYFLSEDGIEDAVLGKKHRDKWGKQMNSTGRHCWTRLLTLLSQREPLAALSSLALVHEKSPLKFCFGVVVRPQWDWCSLSLSAQLSPLPLSDCCVQRVNLPLVPICAHHSPSLVAASTAFVSSLNLFFQPADINLTAAKPTVSSCVLFTTFTNFVYPLQHVNDSIERTSIWSSLSQTEV